MAGPGLEDITLQDGYPKLLVAELSNGISGNMTKVTTSIGVALANSVLWMGQGGDGDDAPHMKIKASSNGNRFFTITDGSGTGVDGNGEYDILSFKSDGSGGSNKQGRGVWSGKCQFDISDRARLEFVTSTSVDDNDNVPTIKQRDSDGSVEFEMEPSTSKYWKFDRLEISAGTTNANAAAFYAPGVNFDTGVITAEGLTMTGSSVLSNTGAETTFNNQNINLEAAVINQIFGSDDTYIEAQATSPSDSSVYIDALTDVASGNNPTVRIGSRNTTTRTGGEYGTKNIIIGDNARDDAEIKLNSRKVSLDNSMLVFDIADGSTWTDGINSSPSGWDGIESSEASLFSIEESSVVKMKWYDGKNSKAYEIDGVQVGKSRASVYTESHATSTTIPTGSDLPTHGVVQYVKEGQSSGDTFLIWKFNNGTAEVFQYINLDSTSNQQVQYSASEPT